MEQLRRFQAEQEAEADTKALRAAFHSAVREFKKHKKHEMDPNGYWSPEEKAETAFKAAAAAGVHYKQIPHAMYSVSAQKKQVCCLFSSSPSPPRLSPDRTRSSKTAPEAITLPAKRVTAMPKPKESTSFRRTLRT
jgi:hypothetical protein